MKHLKQFEKFGFYIPLLLEIKVAKSLVKFINDIHPELNCDYGKKLNQIVIYPNNKNSVLISIYYEDKRIIVTINRSRVRDIISSDVIDYILEICNARKVSFELEPKNISNIIKKLTIEDYNLFLDAKKYNL